MTAVDVYERLVAAAPHPMVIVTTASADGEPAGCLVGFHTQCSIEPVRHLVCLSTVNRTYEIARDSSALTVHRLGVQHRELAQLFGERTGHDTDKFARVPWSLGPFGTPLLDDAPSRWTGRIVDRTPLGDHWGIILEPVDGQVSEPDLDHRVLDSAAVADMEPGHPIG